MVLEGAPAHAQQSAPGPAGSRSYSLLDVLTLSAFGGDVPAFSPLSLWDFGEGWLEPWLPPPNGELHLQRGGWVGADSGFFSREFDPSFCASKPSEIRPSVRGTAESGAAIAAPTS